MGEERKMTFLEWLAEELQKNSEDTIEIGLNEKTTLGEMIEVDFKGE